MVIEYSTIIILCILSFVVLWIERGRHKQTKQKLEKEIDEWKNSESIMDAVFRNVHAYVLLIDSDFKVIRTNYYNRTGMAPQTLGQKRVGDLLQCRNALSAECGCGTHPLCNVCPVRRNIAQAFLDRKDFTDFETTLGVIVADHKAADCQAEISGTYLPIDGVDYMVLTVHDITRQKTIEQALKEAKEQAEHAYRTKSAFLANMSHEIRTPLNAIIGFSELLVAVQTEQEKKQYVDILKTNGELLLQLVNDILDLSKIEAGTLEFIYSDVDVNQLMSDLEQLFKMRVSEADSPVAIIRTPPAIPSCMIHTDKNRLVQVISNFMSNAIKFTPAGSIRFGYEQHDNELYFYVTDTGSGIPEEQLVSVFNRFVRLEKSKKGTGLGLSICRTIIEKMEGAIGVKSVVGSGSTFWFTLPYQLNLLSKEVAEKPLEVEAAPVETSPKREPSGKLTVLVAEDMDDNYRLCEVILSSKYNLLWAHNGEEAISLFLQQQPDVILMDLQMPVVNGFEATQAIRQMSLTIPIIALTAFAYPEDRQKVMDSGFTDFMTKPVSAKVLLAKIESLER